MCVSEFVFDQHATVQLDWSFVDSTVSSSMCAAWPVVEDGSESEAGWRKCLQASNATQRWLLILHVCEFTTHAPQRQTEAAGLARKTTKRKPTNSDRMHCVVTCFSNQRHRGAVGDHIVGGEKLRGETTRGIDPWMDGWMDGRTDGRMDGWMDGRMDGWMDGRMDGWMDGWTDGWITHRGGGGDVVTGDRDSRPCVSAGCDRRTKDDDAESMDWLTGRTFTVPGVLALFLAEAEGVPVVTALNRGLPLFTSSSTDASDCVARSAAMACPNVGSAEEEANAAMSISMSRGAMAAASAGSGSGGWVSGRWGISSRSPHMSSHSRSRSATETHMRVGGCRSIVLLGKRLWERRCAAEHSVVAP